MNLDFFSVTNTNTNTNTNEISKEFKIGDQVIIVKFEDDKFNIYKGYNAEIKKANNIDKTAIIIIESISDNKFVEVSYNNIVHYTSL